MDIEYTEETITAHRAFDEFLASRPTLSERDSEHLRKLAEQFLNEFMKDHGIQDPGMVQRLCSCVYGIGNVFYDVRIKREEPEEAVCPFCSKPHDGDFDCTQTSA